MADAGVIQLGDGPLPEGTILKKNVLVKMRAVFPGSTRA